MDLTFQMVQPTDWLTGPMYIVQEVPGGQDFLAAVRNGITEKNLQYVQTQPHSASGWSLVTGCKVEVGRSICKRWNLIKWWSDQRLPPLAALPAWPGIYHVFTCAPGPNTRKRSPGEILTTYWFHGGHSCSPTHTLYSTPHLRFPC